jgi:hypothetical protein
VLGFVLSGIWIGTGPEGAELARDKAGRGSP